MKLIVSILIMAGVTYAIRMLPFTLFQKEVRSRFAKSVLYYLPYAVLSALTIPAIFSATGNFASALAGTAAAVLLAYFRSPLIVVALAASACAFVVELLLG